MIDEYQFTNNAKGQLASGITDSQTTLSVKAGEGAEFPALTGAKYFMCTLVDTSGNREIVKVTARATDTFTIVREQEGTTKRAFSADDKVELRVTAGFFDALVSELSTGFDLEGLELVLDDDGDSSLHADTDDQLDLKLAGVDKLHFKVAAVEPETDDDIDLGAAAKGFKNVYVTSDVLPTADNASDLGSSAKSFKDAYVDGTVNLKGVSILDLLKGRPRFIFVESLDFTSGGTHEILEGDTVTGDTSGATGYVEAIVVTSGSWAGGDAAGTLYIHTKTDAFQSETLNEGANSNVCTIAADSEKNAVVLLPGSYYHSGSVDRIVSFSSKIAYEFTSLGASDFSYLYLDDSAIVSAGTSIITSSELIDATTEPDPSDSKGGDYNGDDKCIFAVRTDGSSDIIEFYHDGGDLVSYGSFFTDLDDVTIEDDWDDTVTLTIPNFCESGHCTFNSIPDAVDEYDIEYRPTGSNGTGHKVLYIFHGSGTVGQATNTLKTFCDSSQSIDVRVSEAINQGLTVYTDGWYFPWGM